MSVVRSVNVAGSAVVFHSELVLSVREAPASMVKASGGPMCFVDMAYGGFQQLGESVETVAAKVWGDS